MFKVQIKLKSKWIQKPQFFNYTKNIKKVCTVPINALIFDGINQTK